MITLIIILGILYMITGLIAHFISIYAFVSERSSEDRYEAYKKRLNG